MTPNSKEPPGTPPGPIDRSWRSERAVALRKQIKADSMTAFRNERLVAVVTELAEQPIPNTPEPLTFLTLKKAVGGKSVITNDALHQAVANGWAAQVFKGDRSRGFVITEAGRAWLESLEDGTNDDDANDEPTS